MISVKTQETKQSTSCEGVSFTIRKLSRIQRSLRDLPIFEQRLKADDLTRRWWEIKQEQEKLEAANPKIVAITSRISVLNVEISTLTDEQRATSPPHPLLSGREDLDRARAALVAANPQLVEVGLQLAAVDYEFSLVLSSYLLPASIRAGLVSIEGLEIDGKPATPELLTTCATPELDDLVREIYAECEIASGLTSTQRKNSQPLIISTEPVVSEATKSSTAVTASA